MRTRPPAIVAPPVSPDALANVERIPPSPLSEDLIGPLLDMTRQAGAAILEVYKSDFEVRTKSDASPLTEADLAAHDVIATALASLTPQMPLLSEESDTAALTVSGNAGIVTG